MTHSISKHQESVLLVHVRFHAAGMQEDPGEFRQLLQSAGANILGEITGARAAPDPRYFVGTGKAEEIRLAIQQHHVDLVAFNHVLTPGQQRNLERLLSCRVVDRTELILDIFAQRARSFEGRLQVELAMLQHQSTRLVRGWTHLERQRGGIGLRGPGETQIETDRRLIRSRIMLLGERLAKVRKQRELGRRARRRSSTPLVALAGYTNAGKSTLFNRLTGASVHVADQLFATLDPTLRRMSVPHVGFVVLADTVGFIRHLPHHLVEAFGATLEEVRQADLLLHVVDAGDPRRDENIREVLSVLASIGAADVPRILVHNKADLVGEGAAFAPVHETGTVPRISVSALDGAGISDLLSIVGRFLSKKYPGIASTGEAL